MLRIRYWSLLEGEWWDHEWIVWPGATNPMFLLSFIVWYLYDSQFVNLSVDRSCTGPFKPLPCLSHLLYYQCSYFTFNSPRELPCETKPSLKREDSELRYQLELCGRRFDLHFGACQSCRCGLFTESPLNWSYFIPVIEEWLDTIWVAYTSPVTFFFLGWWWATRQSGLLHQKVVITSSGTPGWTLHLGNRHQIYVIFVCMQLTKASSIESHGFKVMLHKRWCYYFGKSCVHFLHYFIYIISLLWKCPTDVNQKEKEKVKDKQQSIDRPKKGQSSKKEWKLWNSFPIIFLDSAKLRLCFEEFFLLFQL